MLSLSIPSGDNIFALALSGYVGMEISSSNSTAQLTLSLTTVDLSALFITSSQVAGVLFIDGSTYVRVPAVTANGKLTAILPGVGQYVFVSIDKSVTISDGVPRAIIAGLNRTYQWGSNLAITFLSDVANTLTVTAQTNATVQGTAQQRSSIGIDLGVYFDIHLSASAQAQESTLQYTYQDALLQAHGIAVNTANRLRWAFYDTVQGAWTLADSAGASVDVSAHVVAQATTHFSSWGVYYVGSSAATALSVSALSIVVTTFLYLAL